MAKKIKKKAVASKTTTSNRLGKEALAKELAKEKGTSVADASRTLNSLLEIIQGNLKKGKTVSLIGFGTFSVKERAARNGRNPQTGKPIKIKARKVVKFKVGSKLSELVK